MVADHTQPVHLLLVVFLSAAAVVCHDPFLEVAEHGFLIGRDRRIDSADAADQRHERCQFADRSTALVFVEQGIGLPDLQRGQTGFIALQFVKYRPDHGVGQLAAAVRLGEEDRQSFDLVAIGFQIVPEVLRHGFRVLMGVAFPFGAEHGVQTVMVDSLFLVAANRVDRSISSPLKTPAASLTSCSWAFWRSGGRRLGIPLPRARSRAPSRECSQGRWRPADCR